MKNSEVIDILQYHIKKTNNVEDIKALTHAIKCVELIPKLVDALCRYKKLTDKPMLDADKLECYMDWTRAHTGLVEKAKELME